MSDPIKQTAHDLAKETIQLRRDFHQHPELAFEEERTASIVAKHLSDLGFGVKTNVGKTGVVALFDTGKPGKTVLARADMDALPVHEEKSSEYRSTIDGKMHACGHDGHTAILLSTAKLLKSQQAELSGKIVFIFQPAEEVVSGAAAMLEDGALDGFTVNHSIGLHLSSSHTLGSVAIRSGAAMAATDALKIIIRGKGGHAAMPHTSIDPVLISAQVITTLQSLVSREINPADQAVISITSLQAGTAFNIIPGNVELKGTLRSFKKATRATLKGRIKQLGEGICQAMQGEFELEFLYGSPAVVNDQEMTARMENIARQTLGDNKVEKAELIMGGDDMALWLNQAPGCYFFVGARNDEKAINYPHHHPMFDIDEASLPLAVELLSKGIVNYLQ